MPFRHQLNGVDHPVCRVPTMTEGRPLAISPPPGPWTPPTLPLPQELESWYLAKIFILSATVVTVVASVEMKARGATRGMWPQPTEKSLLCSPNPSHLPEEHHPPREGPPALGKVRRQHSSHALSPSLPPSPDPASPRRSGPWELAARGGMRISGKKLGAVFSIIVKTRSSNVKTSPLSHEHM